VSSVYVEEFGREISKDEIYQITVVDVMMCSIEVDWSLEGFLPVPRLDSQPEFIPRNTGEPQLCGPWSINRRQQLRVAR
jgi:hypothetical protein